MKKSICQPIFLLINASVFLFLQSVTGELPGNSKNISTPDNQPCINNELQMASNIRKVCSDFFINKNHMIKIKVDPAGVAFNLINENNKWHIILSELKPISPSDKGPLGWRCK
jgi:hypothetical protein